jgi:hypothetical protein
MARIRTIKPEFPQSESIGKLSRDARLLYIQLWTIVDDAGRARAASRMLSSLLYPYDDEARDLIDGWLLELERGEHIRRYEVDGAQYLEIVKWLEHQKIDKPSKSRLPAFVDGSRIVAKVREASTTDLVPSTSDLVPSINAVADAPRAKVVEKKSRKGSATPIPDGYLLPDKIAAYGAELGLYKSEIAREHQRFYNHAKQNDRRCVDWIAAERNWLLGTAEKLGRSPPVSSSSAAEDGLVEVLGEEELAAWDAYAKAKGAKSFPRNARGGWRFPSRWPPGYVPSSSSGVDRPPAPILRTM